VTRKIYVNFNAIPKFKVGRQTKLQKRLRVKANGISIVGLVFIFVSFVSYAEQQGKPVQFNGYSIAMLNNCGANGDNASILKNAYSVFNRDKNNNKKSLTGWNHIKNDKDVEFKGIKLSAEQYQISPERFNVDKSCNGVKTQKAILVKKYSTWQHQHANGIETYLSDPHLLLANIKKIVLDLKINQNHSSIPSNTLLHKAYGKYLSKSQFATFDNSKVNLGITLFETGASNQATSSLNVDKFIEIDQQKYFDQWIRISIPVTEMNYYRELNYAATPVEYNQTKKALITGFRLNPETLNGKVLRNYLGDNWTEEHPKLFKEISISIKDIYIILK